MKAQEEKKNLLPYQGIENREKKMLFSLLEDICPEIC
jgi:hypothetical protein